MAGYLMVQKRKIKRKCEEFSPHLFKPIAIPMHDLEIIYISKEELTALFYADYKQLKQQEAAEKMGISQSSFSRELTSAHKKIAVAFSCNKALQFAMGPSEIKD